MSPPTTRTLKKAGERKGLSSTLSRKTDMEPDYKTLRTLRFSNSSHLQVLIPCFPIIISSKPLIPEDLGRRRDLFCVSGAKSPEGVGVGVSAGCEGDGPAPGPQDRS